MSESDVMTNLFGTVVTDVDGKEFTGLVDAIACGSLQPLEAIRAGYPASMLKHASRFFGVPIARIRAVLLLPETTAYTLLRRGGRLDQSASERLWRMADVAARAREFFQTDEAGAAWLRTPHRMFDGKAPLEFLDTEPGATEVRLVLNAMATGGAA